jgi:ATP-dependent Clp protease ATP-binding subunit ClpA
MREDLMQRIDRHVQDHPKGSVILLQRIEDMAPTVFLSLVHTLNNSNSNNSNSNNNENYKNTIFIFTSAMVEMACQLRLTEYLSAFDASFLADLAHQVDLHFEEHGIWNSRKTMDALVPFAPLTQAQLRSVLKVRVAQHTLQITEAAMDALLDPVRVEYLE